MLEALTVSTSVVFLGEMGDKTQLLALLLAARFRRPLPIMLGILVATLANHAGASALGNWLTHWLDPQWLRWILAVSFLAVAAWMLVPDKPDDEEPAPSSRWGVFGVTVVAFFLAEMGDKTQVATVMLAARYQSIWIVTTGTTLGMMLANVPAVLFGDALIRRVPMAWVHRAAAILFAALGVLMLFGVGLS
jgi:putative Ca2+/H+ antiporter (TMEM165/GDT1 family)